MKLLDRLQPAVSTFLERYTVAKDERFITYSVLIGLYIPTILFVVITAVLAFIGIGPAITPIACAAAIPFYTAAFYFIRTNKLSIANFLIVSALFSAMLIMNLALGNGHVIPIGYAMAAMIAVILNGFWSAGMVIIFGAVSYTLIGYLEIHGQITPLMTYLDNLWINGLGLLMGLSVIVILGWLSNREILELLKREKHLSSELRQKTDELENRIREVEQAEVASKEHADQLEILGEMTKDITLLTSLDDVLYQIMQRCLQLLKSTAGGIYLYRPELDALEWVVSIGDQMAKKGTLLRRGEGISGRLIDTSEVQIIPNYKTWDGPKSPEWPELDASVICAPIRWREEILGVINIRRDDMTAGPFNATDARFIRQFANKSAIAIKNAQLYDKTQREIKERKQIEITLIENERKYRTLMENLAEGVCLLSSTGRFKFINPAVGSIFSISPDDLINQSFEHFLDESQKEIFWHNIRFSSTVKRSEFNLSIRTSLNETRYIYIVASPQQIPDSNEFDILCLLHDITDRKNLEDRLGQAQKMEAIGNLAGGIAHDFNNILTAINGYAEMAALVSDDKERLQKNISGVIKAAARGSNLTKQLLAFSRKENIVLKSINLNILIHDLEKMLKHLIGEDIQIETQLCDDLKMIEADVSQIEQILINLVVNARDAINQRTKKAREKRIIIRTQCTTKNDLRIEGSDQDYIVIAVQDTGIGMDEATQKKIFEPFFTTKLHGEGTGLGLATVYGIVNQNKGQIFIESEVNEGTTFLIYWPVMEETQETDSKSDEAVALMQGMETILVVEDDRAVRDFTCTALSSLGYHVLFAVDGEKALQILKESKHRIDLIITDLVMPNMNGQELLEKVSSEFPEIRIIFTTGYTDFDITSLMSRKDIVHFVQKPYTIRELSAKVRFLLDKTR